MRGKLALAEVERIAQHVEACPKCEQTLQSLKGEDTLAEQLRTEAGQIAKPVGDAVQKLIARMRHRDTFSTDATVAPEEAPVKAEPSLTQAQAKSSGVAAWELDFLAPAQAADELGRLGPYRVLKVLGKGGMGIVFLAHDPHLDRPVALKVMLPYIAANETAKQRFLREAQTAAKLRSDHIVTIYQVNEDRGIPYLAMEYLEGAPLDHFLAVGRKLTVAQILRVGREIAEGLADAHERGLIHRDIKPGNIWLDQNHAGRATILDFGLARFDTDIHITQAGAIVGTPAYMAPEQARGEKVDGRADLFSLGCVLYRLCAGDFPFKAETTMGILMALATADPTPPVKINNQIPLRLSELIMQLLEKDAAKRPQSAREVIARLQAIERSVAGLLKDLQKPDAGNVSNDATDIDTNQANSAFASRERANANATAMAAPSASPRKRRPVVLALAALAAVLLLVLLGVILRFETEKGTLIVEINDPAVEARIKNGKLILTGPDGKDRYTLTPGERQIDAGSYKIRVEGTDGLVLDTPEFTLKNRGEVTVRVTLETPRPIGKSLTIEHTLEFGGDANVFYSTFSPDGRYFLVACDVATNIVGVYETESGKKMASVPGIAGSIFLADSQHILTSARCRGYPDQWCTVWNVATGKEVRRFSAHPASTGFLSRSADGSRAASTNAASTAVVWDVATGKLIAEINTGHRTFISRLTPDGTKLLTVGRDDRTAKLWDVATQKVVHTWVSPDKDFYGLIHWLPQAGTFATAPELAGSFAGLARLDEKATTVNWLGTKLGHVSGVSDDGRLALLREDSSSARVYDIKAGRELGRVIPPTPNSGYMAISPNGRHGLAMTPGGSNKGQARVYVFGILAEAGVNK